MKVSLIEFAWENLPKLVKGELREVLYPVEGFEDEEVEEEEVAMSDKAVVEGMGVEVESYIEDLDSKVTWAIEMAWAGAHRDRLEAAEARNRALLERAKRIRWDATRVWVEE